MKTYIQISGIALLMAFLAWGCVKYDKGGKVYNAEDNLTKNWELKEIFQNGTRVDSVSANDQIESIGQTWTFTDDGTLDAKGDSLTMQGFWNFDEDRKDLNIEIGSPQNRAVSYTYRVKKLTGGDGREMMWKHNLDGDTYWYEFSSP